MNDKSANDKLLFWSLFNITAPFPFLFITALWALLIAILFRFDDASIIVSILSALPMLACPTCCIVGFVLGFKHRHELRKRALMCMGLSTGGLLEYILVLMLLAFLGSIG